MQIFKLIFHHDLLVEQLEGIEQNRTVAQSKLSLEDFMKPMPTYSRFYLSGTMLDEEQFALSNLKSFGEIATNFEQLFEGYNFASTSGNGNAHLFDHINQLPLNSGLVLSENDDFDSAELMLLSGKEYVREYGKGIRIQLEKGNTILFKVAASHGYDIQLFSMKNWYPDMFNILKPFVSNDFRLFSINGKRLSSDRLYYFETYRLNDPPHGFEEVLANTVY